MGGSCEHGGVVFPVGLECHESHCSLCFVGSEALGRVARVGMPAVLDGGLGWECLEGGTLLAERVTRCGVDVTTAMERVKDLDREIRGLRAERDAAGMEALAALSVCHAGLVAEGRALGALDLGIGVGATLGGRRLRGEGRGALKARRALAGRVRAWEG